MSETETYEAKQAVRRQHWYPPIELIPWCFLARLAGTIEEGARKYGTFNWRKADAEFIRDVPRHVVQHTLAYANGDRTEDHLGHAAWGLMVLSFFEETLGREFVLSVFTSALESLPETDGSPIATAGIYT